MATTLTPEQIAFLVPWLIAAVGELNTRLAALERT